MEQKIDKRSKEYKEEMKQRQAIANQNSQESMGDSEAARIPFSNAAAQRIQAEETHPALIRLIETGIPVAKADFHAAVNNADEVPENGFNEKSDNRSRRVEMWLTAGGNILICKQKTKAGADKFFGVPSASVKFVHFKT